MVISLATATGVCQLTSTTLPPLKACVTPHGRMAGLRADMKVTLNDTLHVKKQTFFTCLNVRCVYLHV